MMMRFLLMSFVLIGQVLGAVPALINHQGRIAVLNEGVFSDFHGGGVKRGSKVQRVADQK